MRSTLIPVLLLAVAIPAAGQSTAAPDLGDALAGGTFSLNLRYRFELVDQDAFSEEALASTLRTALDYRTGLWRSLQAYVEVENVSDLGLDDEHDDRGAGSRWNGVDDRPVVADPSITDLNQLYLDAKLGDETTVRVGRQEILHANVRFVGNVGWRQNHQSFEAIQVVTGALGPATLSYTFVDEVRRIFGDRQGMASHLLHAATPVAEGVTLAGYAYLLDYDLAANERFDTLTLGARLDGRQELAAPWRITWDLEAAHQSEAADNPLAVDARYWRAGAGLGRGVWTLSAAREVLEGGPGTAPFATPLATLHAWNGWADLFLATPPAGLVDTWLQLAAASGPWQAAAVWHAFEAEHGGADYGSELDLLLTWRAPWRQVLGAKAALYDADTFATDTTKVWLFTRWGF